VSRGLGRWQRLLLHELYHNPRPPTRQGQQWVHWMNEPWVPVQDFTVTDADDVAARRAARSLASKGLVQIFGGDGYRLVQVTPTPNVLCPMCGLKCSGPDEPNSAEHLDPVGVQVEQFRTPEQQPAVSVPRDYSRWVFGLDGKHYPRTTGGPRRDRRIVLARSAGKSMRAIAAEIGCSVGTVHHVLSQWQAIE
jgi:hypothetical protein